MMRQVSWEFAFLPTSLVAAWAVSWICTPILLKWYPYMIVDLSFSLGNDFVISLLGALLYMAMCHHWGGSPRGIVFHGVWGIAYGSIWTAIGFGLMHPSLRGLGVGAGIFLLGCQLILAPVLGAFYAVRGKRLGRGFPIKPITGLPEKPAKESRIE